MKNNKRKAFTLVEILIAILIIAASWTITATIKPFKQTAKREAGNIASFLFTQTTRSMRKHIRVSFTFHTINGKNIIAANWDGDERVSFDCECSVSCNQTNIPFDFASDTFDTDAKIEIADENGGIYYIHIDEGGAIIESPLSELPESLESPETT